jgi:hypothetical protein
MTWMRWGAVGVMAGLAIACGSDSKFVGFDGGADAAAGTAGVAGSAGSAGDAGGGGSAGAAGGGGSAGTAGSSGSGGTGGGPARTGRVTVALTAGLSLVAWFDGDDGHLEPACDLSGGDCVCRYTREGACIVDACSRGSLTTAAPTAGRVVVENLRTQLSREIAPDTNGQYGPAAMAALSGFDVAVGDRLKISAIGKEVPAFETTLTLSDRIQVLEPDLTRTLELTRTEPLLVRWAAGPAQVRADIVATDADAGAPVSALCNLIGATRRAEIPASALTPLPADPAARTRFYGMDSADVVAGDWSVRVSLVNGTAPVLEAQTVVR